MFSLVVFGILVIHTLLAPSVVARSTNNSRSSYGHSCNRSRCSSRSVYYSDLDDSVVKLRLQVLADYGLERFKIGAQYCEGDVMKYQLNDSLSKGQFHLIYDVLNGTKLDFTVDEALSLIAMADDFIATGIALRKIVDVFVEFAAAHDVELPLIIEKMYIWKELKQQILSHRDLKLRIEDDVIVLDGHEITEPFRLPNLRMMLCLSNVYSKIHIKNMPLDFECAELVQKSLKPHMTSVRFECCPFVFTHKSNAYLNLQELGNLTFFQCTESCARNFMWMLMTLESEELVHLDISKNKISAQHLDRLESILLSKNNLTHINVANDPMNRYEFPKLTGAILGLPKLEFLDVTGNLNVDLFIENLLFLTTPLDNLIHLNVRDNRLHEHITDFCQSLYQFPNLKYLNLSNNLLQVHFHHFLYNMESLKELEEIVIDFQLSKEQCNELLEKRSTSNPNVKITAQYEDFRPKNASHIQLMTAVDLLLIDKEEMETFVAGDFDKVSTLAFKLTKFSNKPDIKYDAFFLKFTNLRALDVTLGSVNNLPYLGGLLTNNLIEEFTLGFYNSATDCEQAAQKIQNFRFKKFAIQAHDAIDWNMALFISILSEAVFWNELETLDCRCFPFGATMQLLKGVKTPKLSKLSLVLDDEDCNLSIEPILSVRTLHIIVKPGKLCNERSIVKILSIAPLAADVRIEAKNVRLSVFDPTLYFHNLRTLFIDCRSLTRIEQVFRRLALLPLLTHLTIVESGGRFQAIKYGNHPDFQSLIVSKVPHRCYPVQANFPAKYHFQ